MNELVYVWPDLYDSLIKTPYQSGFRTLRVVSAFASSAFVNHVIYQHLAVNVDLIIGMTTLQPVTLWDHNEYVRLTRDTGRCRVRYYIGSPPVHSKMVLWEAPSKAPIAFAGSANFTWNGFREFREVMTATDANLLASELAKLSESTVDCVEQDIFTKISVSYSNPNQRSIIDASALGTVAATRPFVMLPLTDVSGQFVPSRSGLNWGQRPGREPNQAYIPIPRRVHNLNPGFFPLRGKEFTMVTDDGFSFVCVVAQDSDKAIETRYDNSILGKYFRKRLGVPLGQRVSIDDLSRYGRKNVTVYRIDDDTFFLDFSRRK